MKYVTVYQVTTENNKKVIKEIYIQVPDEFNGEGNNVGRDALAQKPAGDPAKNYYVKENWKLGDVFNGDNTISLAEFEQEKARIAEHDQFQQQQGGQQGGGQQGDGQQGGGEENNDENVIQDENIIQVDIQPDPIEVPQGADIDVNAMYASDRYIELRKKLNNELFGPDNLKAMNLLTKNIGTSVISKREFLALAPENQQSWTAQNDGKYFESNNVQVENLSEPAKSIVVSLKNIKALNTDFINAVADKNLRKEKYELNENALKNEINDLKRKMNDYLANPAFKNKKEYTPIKELSTYFSRFNKELSLVDDELKKNNLLAILHSPIEDKKEQNNNKLQESIKNDEEKLANLEAALNEAKSVRDDNKLAFDDYEKNFKIGQQKDAEFKEASEYLKKPIEDVAFPAPADLRQDNIPLPPDVYKQKKEEFKTFIKSMKAEADKEALEDELWPEESLMQDEQYKGARKTINDAQRNLIMWNEEDTQDFLRSKLLGEKVNDDNWSVGSDYVFKEFSEKEPVKLNNEKQEGFDRRKQDYEQRKNEYESHRKSAFEKADQNLVDGKLSIGNELKDVVEKYKDLLHNNLQLEAGTTAKDLLTKVNNNKSACENKIGEINNKKFKIDGDEKEYTYKELASMSTDPEVSKVRQDVIKRTIKDTSKELNSLQQNISLYTALETDVNEKIDAKVAEIVGKVRTAVADENKTIQQTLNQAKDNLKARKEAIISGDIANINGQPQNIKDRLDKEYLKKLEAYKTSNNRIMEEENALGRKFGQDVLRKYKTAGNERKEKQDIVDAYNAEKYKNPERLDAKAKYEAAERKVEFLDQKIENMKKTMDANKTKLEAANRDKENKVDRKQYLTNLTAEMRTKRMNNLRDKCVQLSEYSKALGDLVGRFDSTKFTTMVTTIGKVYANLQSVTDRDGQRLVLRTKEQYNDKDPNMQHVMGDAFEGELQGITTACQAYVDKIRKDKQSNKDGEPYFESGKTRLHTAEGILQLVKDMKQELDYVKHIEDNLVKANENLCKFRKANNFVKNVEVNKDKYRLRLNVDELENDVNYRNAKHIGQIAKGKVQNKENKKNKANNGLVRRNSF